MCSTGPRVGCRLCQKLATLELGACKKRINDAHRQASGVLSHGTCYNEGVALAGKALRCGLPVLLLRTD